MSPTSTVLPRKAQDQSTMPPTPTLKEVMAQEKILSESEIREQTNPLTLDGYRHRAQLVLDELDRVTRFLSKAENELKLHMPEGKVNVVDDLPISISLREHKELQQAVRGVLHPYIRRLSQRIEELEGGTALKKAS